MPQIVVPLRTIRRKPRPQPPVVDVDSLSAWLSVAKATLRAPLHRRRVLRVADNALRLSESLRELDDEGLTAKRKAVAARLADDLNDNAAIAEGLALVREVTRRCLGLEAYSVQLAGAAGLVGNMAIEMDTGEGKTLTAMFPAALFALAGRRVHVVTTNDYLAERDLEKLKPVYRALGLSTGLVLHETDRNDRGKQYRQDIVYVSNKEVAFDYLRDRLISRGSGDAAALAEKMRRALNHSDAGRQDRVIPMLDVAIVDEIDSVLIDDAGIPLVISQSVSAKAASDTARIALTVASRLKETQDYRFDENRTGVAITEAGRDRIDEEVSGLTGDWRIAVRRLELIREALTALHIFRRDQHYLVRDGKIVIIDQQTGRTTPDRFWGRDLQAMIELKEEVEFSHGRENIASISFQRFFRSYRTLSGMSGTVREVRAELARVYGLEMVRIPRRRPLQRAKLGYHFVESREKLWQKVVDEARRFHKEGRPLLIGVRTVGDARYGAERCAAAGLQVRVLTAEHEREEAEIVEMAGNRSSITLATHLAGRGTDIALGEGVAELGGILVMLCERHESHRIDRQFIGRSARQGDPGGVIEFLSLEDGIVKEAASWRRHLATLLRRTSLGRWMVAHIQNRAERYAAARRIDLVRHDKQLHKILAFSGGLDQ